MNDDTEPLNPPEMPCADCGTALDAKRYIEMRIAVDEYHSSRTVALCRRCWADRKAGTPYEKGVVNGT